MSETHFSQLLSIGRLYSKRGLCSDAEKILKQALELQTTTENFDTSNTAVALYYLGDLYRAQGLHGQAIPYFKMALRIWSRTQEFEPIPDDLWENSETYLKEQAREIVLATLSGLDSNSSITPIREQ